METFDLEEEGESVMMRLGIIHGTAQIKTKDQREAHCRPSRTVVCGGGVDRYMKLHAGVAGHERFSGTSHCGMCVVVVVLSV